MADLDWEDRERVLRLMFSKMNTGQPASNWRIASGESRGEHGIDGGRTTGGGAGSKRTGRGGKDEALNRSFREEEEYD